MHWWLKYFRGGVRNRTRRALSQLDILEKEWGGGVEAACLVCYHPPSNSLERSKNDDNDESVNQNKQLSEDRDTQTERENESKR